MSCLTSSAFMLMDFQGHALDLAGAVNPIISFTPNNPPSANQAWIFLSIVPGTFSVASGTNVESGELQFISYDIASPTQTFMQAIANTSNGITFDVNCLSSTTGTLTDSVTKLALTAWQAESGSVPSPITYDPLTGRPQQIWTFEALD
ncbi:hypothetical protein C8R45DRAFT_1072622 [Mycena sanguinolenta]|nr:hypothetical protein C8R45DRAFT_1072622 [Mycena sanguinolenta]